MSNIPQAELAFELEVTCDPPQPLGEKDGGRMLMIPITGGTITGPLLQGEVLPGGADWAVVYDGKARVEARYAIRAADGTIIQVFNGGLVSIGAPGQRVLTTPRFIAPEGPHEWLNAGVFAGTLVADPVAAPGLVKIGVYRIV